MSNEHGIKYPADGISFRSPTLLFPAFTTFTDGSIMHAWKGRIEAPPQMKNDPSEEGKEKQ